MTPERWAQISQLYQAALEVKSEDRLAYLKRACGEDSALREEVESLLVAEKDAAGFLVGGALPNAAKLLVKDNSFSLIGQNLNHYQVISLLGEGGMGEVYCARDTKLDRTVALKVLPLEFASDKDRMRRFVREAKAASAMNHPNIAHIYEIGETAQEAGSVHFIAMECVEGQTLAARINSQPLKISEIVEISSQIADALEEANSKGITHRDIKPANVMLTPRGQVKVLDFGLAKITPALSPSSDSNVSTMARTQSGVVMGTVPYMSPEQALGKEIDHRSDLFSLGVVLYEMATGRLPFAGSSTSETLDRILHSQPEAIARFNYDVPAELERIVRKCLEKERERRYQSARELLVDLKNQQRDSGSKAMSAEQVAVLPSRRLSRRSWAAIAIIILMMIGVGIYALFGRGRAIESVAVLPFVNVGADPDTEYLSDGISESLINSLSQLPRLRVMSREAVSPYKRRETSAQAAGQELKVQAVLTGRVVQRGDDLSISVALVDARDNSHLWGEQYHQKLVNILQVQEKIARDVAEKLRLKLTGEEQKRLTKLYPENREAYQLYLKGLYFREKRTEKGYQKAIEHFQQALDLDPNYALAYVGLADIYHHGGITAGEPQERIPRVKAMAMKALAIDETLGEAHTALARVIWQYEWNWSAAETEFKRAIELDPNNAFAHRIYSYYLASMGRHDESVATMKQAQQLDPLSIVISLDVGQMLYYAGQNNQAMAQFRKTQELDPNYWGGAYHRIGMVYCRLGKYAEAVAELDKGLSLARENETTIALLGYAYGLWGKRDEAVKQLDELMKLSKRKYISPLSIAIIYTGLGEKDQAFALLQRACDEREPMIVFLKVWPIFESLRNDPRFTALLRRIGLES